MLKKRNYNILLNFNHDKVIGGFTERSAPQMSYQEIAISRLRGNVNFIKDEVSRNGMYCKNIERKL